MLILSLFLAVWYLIGLGALIYAFYFDTYRKYRVVRVRDITWCAFLSILGPCILIIFFCMWWQDNKIGDVVVFQKQKKEKVKK